MIDGCDWNRQADQRILEWLEAAAEDTRQRDLTRSLGQAECRGNHRWWNFWPGFVGGVCTNCKAVL